jgi:hypothetical protein
MSYVDGNAVIGALSLAIGTDAGEAALVCAACGHAHPVAQSQVYLRCPGMVLRCPNCSGAEIVLVEIEHRVQLTLSGVASIEFPSMATAPAPSSW